MHAPTNFSSLSLNKWAPEMFICPPYYTGLQDDVEATEVASALTKSLSQDSLVLLPLTRGFRWDLWAERIGLTIRANYENHWRRVEIPERPSEAMMSAHLPAKSVRNFIETAVSQRLLGIVSEVSVLRKVHPQFPEGSSVTGANLALLYKYLAPCKSGWLLFSAATRGTEEDLYATALSVFAKWLSLIQIRSLASEVSLEERVRLEVNIRRMLVDFERRYTRLSESDRERLLQQVGISENWALDKNEDIADLIKAGLPDYAVTGTNCIGAQWNATITEIIA